MNVMQVLQVQHAMAAQAATKHKEAEALIQAKIDAELEKKKLGLVKPKNKTANIADVAPDDDGVLLASGMSKWARNMRSAGRNMLNEHRKWRIFVTAFTCSRKHLRKWLHQRLQRSQVHGYSSEDDTRPNTSKMLRSEQ